MKRRPSLPDQKAVPPLAPVASGKSPADKTANVAPKYATPPAPHPATTEEAMEAWRNEGDPN